MLKDLRRKIGQTLPSARSPEQGYYLRQYHCQPTIPAVYLVNLSPLFTSYTSAHGLSYSLLDCHHASFLPSLREGCLTQLAARGGKVALVCQTIAGIEHSLEGFEQHPGVRPYLELSW